MPDHSNEAAGTDDSGSAETWIEQTSAFDRVMSVALSLDEPKTAKWIADESHVAETTARNHLERLVELRVLVSSTTYGTTTYSPDSGYLRFRKASEVVERREKDEIVNSVAELKADIESWRDEYGVEDPDELRVKATEDGVSAEETREYLQVASEWDSCLHEKSIMRDAVERYEQFENSDREEIRI